LLGHGATEHIAIRRSFSLLPRSDLSGGPLRGEEMAPPALGPGRGDLCAAALASLSGPPRRGLAWWPPARARSVTVAFPARAWPGLVAVGVAWRGHVFAQGQGGGDPVTGWVKEQNETEAKAKLLAFALPSQV
jgi:hypothetical protein